MWKFASLAVATLGLTAGFSGVGHAATAASSCQPRTASVASLPASAVLRTMTANMQHACGFSMSGIMMLPGFVDNWLQLTAPAAYDARGDAHLRYVDQGIFIDVYRAGGNEYLRMNGPAFNVVPQWHAFGVKNTWVIKAAGTTKWVRLTAAERSVFDKATDGTGRIGNPAALGASMASGFGQPWHLRGLTLYRGIRCVKLTQSWTDFGAPMSTAMYVAAATGLPVAVVVKSGQSVAATFGNWGHVAPIAAPRVSQVVSLEKPAPSAYYAGFR